MKMNWEKSKLVNIEAYIHIYYRGEKLELKHISYLISCCMCKPKQALAERGC